MRVNGVTVLAVEGRIDSVTAPDFEAQLLAALDTAQRLVIDLRQLLYISSAGFRVSTVRSRRRRRRTASWCFARCRPR